MLNDVRMILLAGEWHQIREGTFEQFPFYKLDGFRCQLTTDEWVSGPMSSVVVRGSDPYSFSNYVPH